MTDEEFCALYEAHSRRLWAYVARATRSRATADDSVQETFLRIFEAASMNRADADHRRNYLYTIATNLIRRDHGRRHESPTQDSFNAAVSECPDEKLAVERALRELSEVERQTLLAGARGAVVSSRDRPNARIPEGSLRQVAVRAKRRFIQAFTGNTGAERDPS
jgi:DNA-directed RNA polymerase specialized sigma24 family protein